MGAIFPRRFQELDEEGREGKKAFACEATKPSPSYKWTLGLGREKTGPNEGEFP